MKNFATRNPKFFGWFIEIKLGGDKLIEEGAANLNKLKDDVDDPNMAFMAIITATGPAYRRKDGIYVIPLNCMKA